MADYAMDLADLALRTVVVIVVTLTCLVFIGGRK